MKRKVFNGSIMKIAMIAVFLVFLVGTASAACDVYVESITSDYKYNDTISAMEDNLINVKICCSDDEGLSGVTSFDLTVTVSDDGTVYEEEDLDPISAGACVEYTFTDDKIRTTEDPVTYTATISNINPTDTNSGNNVLAEIITVKYNGYKGKYPYWPDKYNFTTKQTYNLANGTMVYYNQTEATYAGTSWEGRTETWTTTNLPVPAWATVEDARLYISYNWGSNSNGDVPNFDVRFNDNPLSLNDPLVLNGHYTDKSNIGTYGNKMYGLLSINVTEYYNQSINNILFMDRDSDNMALYPSTLVVVYSDTNETKKKIYINEEADELLVSPTGYGTTEDEAKAYIPFSIDTTNVNKATLYSFAASAGHPTDPPASPNEVKEGNLFFNTQEKYYAWEGTSKSAYPYKFDLTSGDLTSASLAKIQGTSATGLLGIEQILVVEYNS